MPCFLTEEEIDELLNASEDESVILAEKGQTSEDESVILAEKGTEAASLESEEEEDDAVQQSEDSSSRGFWLSKQMSPRGPNISDDILKSEGTPGISCLYSFFEYLDLEFWNLVADQTNLYSVQQRDLRSVKTDQIEMINFTGIQIMMGTLNYPQARLYWGRDLSVPIIVETMKRDRFFELRNHIHFADNTAHNQNGDKLWKIRPILSKRLQKCHSLPRSKHMSINEQMIPFSGRCAFRKYVPSKPNPLGLKNFVLAARDGLVLDFAIYVGSNTVPSQDMTKLDLGGSIVKLLCRTIHQDSVLYTDRFFTSLRLADYLQRGCIPHRDSDEQPVWRGFQEIEKR